jgi:hypothetical protein
MSNQEAENEALIGGLVLDIGCTLIGCIGEDRKLHLCEPHNNSTYCGVTVLKKSPRGSSTHRRRKWYLRIV